MFGEGAYDGECTVARESAQAQAALLIIVNGQRGSGFSVQVVDTGLIEKIPAILRSMAEQIDADIEQRRQG
jgi:hypothetical protein